MFDAETIPNADNIFVKLAGCKYVSKFDLSKGYWQLPLDDSSKQITAFQTPLGLYQFTVIPFGLVNASPSYSRLMRKLLEGMQCVDNFVDDVIIYTSTFQEHLSVVRELLQRLRAANLTVIPSKCFIGYRSLECLGHIAGDEKLRSLPDKVTALQNFNRPSTKKQTDASDVGVAVLLQYEDGVKKPVAYASKKLSKSQVNYSTIEKECYAIAWAVQKFQRYLYGQEFYLETDHQPLVYLSKSKVLNARLMRWALVLQPYRFRTIAIKGSENVGAYCLSRL